MCDEIQYEKLNSLIDLYADRSFQLKYLSVATVCYAWPMPTESIFQWFSVFGAVVRREWGWFVPWYSSRSQSFKYKCHPLSEHALNTRQADFIRQVYMYPWFSRLVCVGLPRHTNHLMLVSPPRGVSNDWCVDTSCSHEWWCRQVLYLLMRWHDSLT